MHVVKEKDHLVTESQDETLTAAQLQSQKERFESIIDNSKVV